MELALTKYDEMVNNAINTNDENVKTLSEKYNQATRVGARKLAKSIKKMILGYVLKKENMQLLEISPKDFGGEHSVWSWNEDGSKEVTTDNTRYWKMSRINKFRGNIPIEVLNKLPDAAHKKARILEPGKGNVDPYIIVKIKGRICCTKYYVAVAQWE